MRGWWETIEELFVIFTFLVVCCTLFAIILALFTMPNEPYKRMEPDKRIEQLEKRIEQLESAKCKQHYLLTTWDLGVSGMFNLVLTLYKLVQTLFKILVFPDVFLQYFANELK